MKPDDDLCTLEKLTVGELNLAAVARYYKMIRMIQDGSGFMQENEKDVPESKAREKISILSRLLVEGPYMNEKNVALMMIFEEFMEAPKRQRIIDRILGGTIQ